MLEMNYTGQGVRDLDFIGPKSNRNKRKERGGRISPSACYHRDEVIHVPGDGAAVTYSGMAVDRGYYIRRCQDCNREIYA